MAEIWNCRGQQASRGWAVSLILLALFALAACGGGKAAESPAGVPAPAAGAALSGDAAAPASAGLSSDPETAVRAALKAQVTGAPFRVTSSLTMDGETTEQVIEYVAPQTLAMKMGDMEIRIVGGKAYQNLDGVWEESPVATAIAGGMKGMYDPEEMESMIGTLSNVREAGGEVIDGASVRVYEYDSVQDLGAITATSKQKLWVRESDGLPVKSEAETESNGTKSATSMKIEYIKGLTVEAP